MTWFAAPVAMPLAFMSFGFTEILLVGVVALLVFGGDLPDVMRSLGRSYAKIRGSLHELSRPVRKELQDLKQIPPPARHVPGPVVARSAPSDPPEDYPEYPSPPADDEGTPGEAPQDVASPPAEAGGVADEPPPV